MYDRNPYEWDLRKRRRTYYPLEQANQSLLDYKIERAVAVLDNEYIRFKMFGHRSAFGALNVESLRHLFVISLGAFPAIIFYTILKHSVKGIEPRIPLLRCSRRSFSFGFAADVVEMATPVFPS